MCCVRDVVVCDFRRYKGKGTITDIRLAMRAMPEAPRSGTIASPALRRLPQARC